jgi:MraZ protein
MKTPTSFKGKSHHTINEAGRVSIPSKFRDVLKTKYGDESLTLVTLGSHIAAFPTKEWQKLEETWEANPPKDGKGKKFLRYLYSTAEDCTIDKQGRILVPNMLRESTGLNSECVIVGHMNKIEIWPKAKWDKEFEDINVENLFDSISEEFPELNL